MTETKNKVVKCKQNGCTASVDGKCLEGLELGSCPHCEVVEEGNNSNLIIEPEPIKNGLEEINKSEAPSFFCTHLGNALNLDDANSISCSSLTRLILLAGLIDSGKTTMIASLYDLFQKQNSFAGYSFAGSKTLIGFEKRCHDSRIKSGRTKAVTERTKLSSPEFLHLKVKNGLDCRDLLFTDISGELFKNLSNSTEDCRKFDLAKRADHFVLFIDSDQLSNAENKHKTKTRSISILRSLDEAQVLNAKTFIQIVFSRWDMLALKNDKLEHESFVTDVKEEIAKKFSKKYKNLLFFEIASRPNNTESFHFGYGIDKLFPYWVENSPFVETYYRNNISHIANNLSREYLKYIFE